MRAALVAMVGIVAVSGVVGCGGAADPQAGAGSATAVESAYAATVAAGSARVSIDLALNALGAKVDVDGSGAMDLAHRRRDLAMSVLGMSMEARYLDRTEYLHLPGTGQWLKVDPAEIVRDNLGDAFGRLVGNTPSDPLEILGYLRGADGDVRDGGSAVIDGVPTTLHTATISLDELARRESLSGAELSRLEQLFGGKIATMRLWVDGHNRLRRLSYDQKLDLGRLGGPNSGLPDVGPFETTLTMTLSGFGTPVTIVAPPADQVDDIAGALRGGR